MEINSKEYWNDRFTSGDWEKYDGESQSAFFSELFVNEMPDWLKKDLEENEWQVADYGCAEGSGTAVLAKYFPYCRIKGYDISESGIEKARRQHPQCQYDVRDIYEDIEEVDVVFSSNTLEHLNKPFSVMCKLVKASREHTILMLPFEDDHDIKEHINRFSAAFFPDKIENHRLTCFKVIDCREEEARYWNGKQVLIVYTNVDFCEETTRWTAELYEYYTREYVERAYLEKKRNWQLTQKIAEIMKQKQRVDEQLMLSEKEKSAIKEQLEKLSAEKEVTEESLQKLIAKHRKLTGKCAELDTIITEALCKTEYLATTRKFKMLHMLTRIRRQMFNSNAEERKLFFKWLWGRRKAIPNNDHRYNPVFEIIDILKRKNAIGL